MDMNLDEIFMRRVKEDRNRGQEDEAIFSTLLTLQKENVQLKARLQAMTTKAPEAPQT